MSCTVPHHSHTWPDQGLLDIQVCERSCLYCRSLYGVEKKWSRASDLRTHVKTVHTRRGGSHSDVEVVLRHRTGGRLGGRPEHTDNGQELSSSSDALPVRPSKRPRVSNFQGNTGVEAEERRPMMEQPTTRDVPVPYYPLHQQQPTSTTRPAADPQSTTQPVQIIISDNDIDIMRDMHCQLHLRQNQEVLDAFFLLFWHHVLRANIPELDHLSKTVHPGMMKFPPALVPVIASFLREYGPLLWPTKTRSHLTQTSRLALAGVWRDQGPNFETDSRQREAERAEFRMQIGREPHAEEILAHSPLGSLLKIYLLAALHRSLVDDAYMHAVTADPGESLHTILVADEDVQPEPVQRFKSRCEASGPLGNALRLEEGQPWDTESAHRIAVKSMLRDTGGLGGLPNTEMGTVGGAETLEGRDISQPEPLVVGNDSGQAIIVEQGQGIFWT